MKKIHIVKTWEYVVGTDAYDKEQEILAMYSHEQYTGIDKMLSSGNTELFMWDVLGLDKNYS